MGYYECIFEKMKKKYNSTVADLTMLNITN